MNPIVNARYSDVSSVKSDGATYTPKGLSDFVANKMVENATHLLIRPSISILDPAIGDGELVVSLLQALARHQYAGTVHVSGYDVNAVALSNTNERISSDFPNATVALKHTDFLETFDDDRDTLFAEKTEEKYDLVIANPPYVRTQVLGAKVAQLLSQKFSLSGRVDLYFAFLLGIGMRLTEDGVAGLIVSNRFMITKSGTAVREGLLDSFNLSNIWDLGDTKIFEAAVLPAVLLGRKGQTKAISDVKYTSIYEIDGVVAANIKADPVEALSSEGVVGLEDGRVFNVQAGRLHTGSSRNGVWSLQTDKIESWLDTVTSHTWKCFGDVGNIRVGIKTCSDKVFIRSDWAEICSEGPPELLKPLLTHHSAQRFAAKEPKKVKHVIYPHEVVEGKRQAVNIEHYPHSKAYFEENREKLESRKYVIDGGRQWYEIWVPHDPDTWIRPKIVFRDIAKRPTFWMDKTGAIVNGDCYWLVTDNKEDEQLLWLALAVANSTFIESYYDYSFNNKLYAGRRRFITQYVKQFPLPSADTPLAAEIISLSQSIYEQGGGDATEPLQAKLDEMVWQSFGLISEKIPG